ncbi:hypothetical protein B0H67DRAFT_550022 [Lasiosphaeris hirsuta]|uniref:Uncharacterized protein n=1 Tax=Lasiosphaeris hirsuta TaxID=260670 RepID=A0AA40AY90_9PEZI|nr:hypothetical protein B0H67DRAFT_550022 [Lasiosphaeris hirsuta]
MASTNWEDLVPARLSLQEVANELANDDIPHMHLDSLPRHHARMIRSRWEAKQQADKDRKAESKAQVDQSAARIRHWETTAEKTAQRHLAEYQEYDEENALAIALERSHVTAKEEQSRTQSPELEETDRLWKKYHEAIRELIDDEVDSHAQARPELYHPAPIRFGRGTQAKDYVEHESPFLEAQRKSILRNPTGSATRARSASSSSNKHVKFSDPAITAISDKGIMPDTDNESKMSSDHACSHSPRVTTPYPRTWNDSPRPQTPPHCEANTFAAAPASLEQRQHPAHGYRRPSFGRPGQSAWAEPAEPICYTYTERVYVQPPPQAPYCAPSWAAPYPRYPTPPAGLGYGPYRSSGTQTPPSRGTTAGTHDINSGYGYVWAEPSYHIPGAYPPY